MAVKKHAKRIGAVLAVLILAVAALYFYLVTPHHSSAPPESADGLMDRADTLAWGNRWADAQPLYLRAEHLYRVQGKPDRALYAEVSQIPPDESGSVAAKILALQNNLLLPEARDQETRLRILTIEGMLETNYDAGRARATWEKVESLAWNRHHFELATRAVGEQGIAAFLLGNIETAKKQVVRAWTLSKIEHDPAATVRYASVFGAGLVELRRYHEALTPLDTAIHLASSNPALAYPSIAVYAKIDALAGLKQYDAALALANSCLARLQGTLYEQHKAQVYESIGGIQRDKGNLQAAAFNYQQSVKIANDTSNFRGQADAGGALAETYEQIGDLPSALKAINAAIRANSQIPDELYLTPRNLATKARILDKLGQTAQAEAFYKEAIVLTEEMLRHAVTTNIERNLLAEMSDVYTGYFAYLCSHRRYNEALSALEEVRGRIETHALQHHALHSIQTQTPEQLSLNALNVALIDTDDPSRRATLTNAIYTAELQISPKAPLHEEIQHPVGLASLRSHLSPKSLLIEYVLAEPFSYAFAITAEKVTPYRLSSRHTIEDDARQYRQDIRGRKQNAHLGQQLFSELLEPIKEYAQKPDLVVIPDGALNLLPFSALVNQGSYVVKTHTVAVAPSSTVFALIQQRIDHDATAKAVMPYIGVAAWTLPADTRNPILRAVTGPERSELVALPDSKKEVEAIAGDLPHPNTIFLGADATASHFIKAAGQSTDVIHLALHGYSDLEYPDRSALLFAPDPARGEGGLLQIRDIRNLHLRAKLVTLSACDTGVGPVGESGVANIVNAFIEAGADSVVSTLWELEDEPTEHLMVTFYSGLAQHESKVEALRNAQLDMISNGLPPYYWASFQMVGDPDATI